MDPTEPEPRSWPGTWLLFAAIGVVIFLVGVTLGVLSRRSSTVRVTTTVTAAAAPSPGAARGSFTDGLYRVGVDISAGDYHTSGGANCYWERLNDVSGGFAAIITNGQPTGPTTVQVDSTDKGFSVHGGCTWAPVR
jgi:hypothetical protein